MGTKRKRERLYRIEEVMQEHNLSRKQVVRRCTVRGVELQQDPDVEYSCLTMIAESDLPKVLRRPK